MADGQVKNGNISLGVADDVFLFKNSVQFERVHLAVLN